MRARRKWVSQPWARPKGLEAPTSTAPEGNTLVLREVLASSV